MGSLRLIEAAIGVLAAAAGLERYFPTPCEADGDAADSSAAWGCAARSVPNHLRSNNERVRE